MKHFYSHLIEIESIIIRLDKMNLSKEEKLHLAHLIDSNLHHVVLNAVLSELNDEDKRTLMNSLDKQSHDKIWKFLNERVEGIEEKIKKAADGLKVELDKDLKEAERIKGE